jgi:hypothetical protein
VRHRLQRRRRRGGASHTGLQLDRDCWRADFTGQRRAGAGGRAVGGGRWGGNGDRSERVAGADARDRVKSPNFCWLTQPIEVITVTSVGQ